MHAGSNSTSSIFSRINYLLEVWEPRAEHLDKKGELLIVLITSFYLNLARNDENIQFLLQIGLFSKLTSIMRKMISPDFD